MNDFLHGVEVIEIESGGRVITTPSTSTIGLIGTAVGENIEKTLPLNKPVLFRNIQQVEKLGLLEEGTIVPSLRSIYNQTSTFVVVVRVEKNEDMEQTIKNCAGDLADYSGVYALMKAQSALKVKPKLVLCPYYSSITTDGTPNAIVNSLCDVADKLRAVALIDGTNTTNEEVINFAGNISSSRAMVIDPAYIPYFELHENNPLSVSSSSLLAGVFAKNDTNKGFWYSPSNTAVDGIKELARPISFALSDKTTDSNYLNSKGVTTIIFSNGEFKIWGNRSPSLDNKWHYISVRRTVDTVYDALENSIEWALARPFSKQLFSDIENNVQTYLNRLIARGALLGGQVWVDNEENNIETYTNGQLIVKFDLEPPSPLERLTFKAYRNSEYIEELFN